VYDSPFIISETVYYGISLNTESLFKRNISHFGPTTLRATICSNILTMADIKMGDVVVDPMCGGGSIPIEGGR
jgi:23S rRNA G2445 N2-methylase RlmL